MRLPPHQRQINLLREIGVVRLPLHRANVVAAPLRARFAALAGFRAVADLHGISWPLSSLATLATQRRDFAQAEALMTESLTEARKTDYPRHLAWMLCLASNPARLLGHFDQAAALSR